MPPFAIINDIGFSFEKNFRSFVKKINEPLLKSFFSYIKLDSAIILDSKNPLELLQELKSKYGEFIDLEKLKTEIINNYRVLDAWAVSQINKSFEKEREALRNKNLSDEEIDKRVPLIPKKDLSRLSNIPLASKSSMLFQNEAYKKYFNDIEDLLTDEILSKTGKLTEKEIEAITKKILDKVDMNASRARFWVEDQAKILYSKQYRLACQRAGHTHYRWKSRSNARASHAIHNNQIVSWSVGVNNLSRPGARHAGEDYRCNCEPEILTSEELAKVKLNGGDNQTNREPQSTDGLAVNYEGSEEFRSIKGAGNFSFLDNVSFVGLNTGNKNSAMIGLVELNRVIDMEEISTQYPIEFKPLPLEMYSGVAGAYFNSTIYLNKATENVLTVIHEFGHHLERLVLGNRASFLTSKEGIELISKVKETASFKSLLKSKIPLEKLGYYTSEKEIFSRLIEQYLAKKRGGEILRQFEKSQLIYFRKYKVDLYIKNKEFELIEKMIDNIFKTRKLLK